MALCWVLLSTNVYPVEDRVRSLNPELETSTVIGPGLLDAGVYRRAPSPA